MSARTLLLALHITAIASWLGADVVQLAMRNRWDRESPEAVTAWARMQFWLHDRYYAVVAVFILLTGVALVQHGHWGWRSGFIWVGISAIVAGGTLGGIGLKGLAKKRLTSLEAGDIDGATAASRRALPIEIFLTAVVLVTVVAMVHRWVLTRRPEALWRDDGGRLVRRPRAGPGAPHSRTMPALARRAPTGGERRGEPR